MKGQKGQSAVEFALVIPLFLILVVGMIYGGFAYVDYINYGNAVRKAAREISVQTDAAKRATLKSSIDNGQVTDFTPMTNLYTGTFHVDDSNPNLVTVSVTFTTNYAVDFLPISPIKCTMPLEWKESTQTENSQN